MKGRFKSTALLALLLAMIMLLSACVAPVGSGNDETSANTADTTEITGDVTTIPDDPTPKEIIIKAEGKDVNYSIIRPDDDTGKDISVIVSQSIRDGIGNLLGASPDIGTDFIAKGTEHDPETLEILVGLVNYNETASVAKDCNYGDYALKLVGNKVIVLGFSSNALTKAGNEFVNIVRNSFDENEKTIKIKADDLNIHASHDKQLAELPLFENSTFKSYYNAGERIPGARCDEIILSNTTPEAYDAYLAKLKSAGYTEYTSREVVGNKFATLNSDKYTINIGYYNYEKGVRILIEPLAPMTGLKSENVYTKVTTSQITLLGVSYGTSYNGLCVLMRSADGRFIIVDGAFNHAESCKNIIKVIKEQAKEYTNNPVIAAWIITHAHGDHSGLIGNSGKATEIKNSGISVERFIVNFMSDEERNKSMSDSTVGKNWSENEGSAYKNVISTATTIFNADIHKVHVGQVFYFGDIELESLYTLESFAPKLTNAFNTTSIVFKVTFDGKTTYLSTGDATGHGMQIIDKMYGDYMQVDIVQVCHHGYTTWGNDTGMANAYKRANATLVLWPQGLGTDAFDKYRSKSYNAPLFKTSNYKECYVAGSIGDIVVVPMPYTVGNVSYSNPLAKK